MAGEKDIMLWVIQIARISNADNDEVNIFGIYFSSPVRKKEVGGCFLFLFKNGLKLKLFSFSVV